MKTLPLEFTKKQFHHKQIWRAGSWAIYERWKDNQKPHYELIRIKSHNGYEMAGVKIEPGEIYPWDEKFGTDGWTLNSFEAAMEKYNKIRCKV